MVDIRTPLISEMPEVYALRWSLLRQPWGEEAGSERDDYDVAVDTIHGVAFEDGRLIGTGRIHVPVDNSDEYRVRYMAIDPESRGKGVGAQVLAFMEKTAFDLGAPALGLNARKEAITFYLRAGYTAVSEEIFFHGKPHYSMVKSAP